MSCTVDPPGKSLRLQLAGSSGRYSTVWSIVSGKRTADLYVSPRMMGGAVKVSMHQSGSWQVGLTRESPVAPSPGLSRHWDIWTGGTKLSEGLVRAWYLLVPDDELRAIERDPKARELPEVGANHALSLEILLMSNTGPVVAFDAAHVVGRWSLVDREESYLVVARRIPWYTEQQAWIKVNRERALASLGQGDPLKPEHRYYLHGHDADGTRFGVELAAI
jgi:hypothetical protein